MANYSTSADILDAGLRIAGEPTDGTSDFNTDAIEALNSAYRMLQNGGRELAPDVSEDWWWLRKDDHGTIILNPIIETGTVSVTNNSASITFSSGPTPSVAGRHFKVKDHADVFIISSHTATETGATLDSVYTGDTNATASYRVSQYDYSLASDFISFRNPITSFQSGKHRVRGVDLNDLKMDWPLQMQFSGVPRDFAMLTETSVRFSHAGGLTSTDLIRLDYEYNVVLSDLADDSTEPSVPLRYRGILAHYIAGYILTLKNDERAQIWLTAASNGVRSMSREHRTIRGNMADDSFGRIRPRQEDTPENREPLRTESGDIIG